MENLTPEQAIERIEKSIAEKTEGFVSSEDLDGIKADLASVKEIAEKDNTSELKASIAKLEGMVEGLKEAKKEDEPKARSLGQAISFAFKSAKEKIVETAEKGGLLNLETKAAGTMLIDTNYSGGTVGLSSLEGGLTRIQRRRPFLRSLVNSANTTSKYIAYIEQKNADPGVAGTTAEGAEKTQTDFDLVETSAEVKKITAYIKVSKEMIADIPFMQGEINNELMELVALKLDEQILLGDGLGANLEGIDAVATAWSAGTFAASIASANNSDVLRVAIAQIAGQNFEANYILLNPADVAAMELTKTSTGEYTYPMFVPGPNGVTTVKGIPVVESTLVTAGDFYVGDFTKANLRVREDMNVQVGYVNDDFTKNLMTVLVEMRAAFYVKSNHARAFVKGDFATAIAALQLP